MDITLQIARCSFDLHVADIVGSMAIGSTVIMLRPDGTLDFPYLAKTIKAKTVTHLTSVPSLLTGFVAYVHERFENDSLQSIRSLCSGGKY